MYREWKNSDAVVVVGFGFGADDEHINGILRTLVNDDRKELIIVTKGASSNAKAIARQNAKNLKISDSTRIRVIAVGDDGKVDGKRWIDLL